MVHIKVYIATSLDGYIAREDGSIDWLPQSDDIPEGEDFGFGEFLAGIDRLVMGRKTFESVLGFPEWPYGDLRVDVLSRTGIAVPPELGDRVQVVSATLGELLHRWESQGVQSVYLDGGETIQGFLAAGLVDEMTITRVPVLLGKGRPLFGSMTDPVHWEHHQTDVLPMGMVRSRYARI